AFLGAETAFFETAFFGATFGVAFGAAFFAAAFLDAVFFGAGRLAAGTVFLAPADSWAVVVRSFFAVLAAFPFWLFVTSTTDFAPFPAALATFFAVPTVLFPAVGTASAMVLATSSAAASATLAARTTEPA